MSSSLSDRSGIGRRNHQDVLAHHQGCSGRRIGPGCDREYGLAALDGRLSEVSVLIWFCRVQKGELMWFDIMKSIFWKEHSVNKMQRRQSESSFVLSVLDELFDLNWRFGDSHLVMKKKYSLDFPVRRGGTWPRVRELKWSSTRFVASLESLTKRIPVSTQQCTGMSATSWYATMMMVPFQLTNIQI